MSHNPTSVTLPAQCQSSVYHLEQHIQSGPTATIIIPTPITNDSPAGTRMRTQGQGD